MSWFRRGSLTILLSGVALAAAPLTASLTSTQVAQSTAPDYPPVPPRPALIMPTVAQAEAIAAYHAAVQSRVREAMAARSALLEASLASPMGAAVIREKAT